MSKPAEVLKIQKYSKSQIIEHFTSRVALFFGFFRYLKMLLQRIVFIGAVFKEVYLIESVAT